MNENLTIYHGSPQVVEYPSLKEGRPYNDYGRGFYCTPDFNLAGEWACKSKTSGYINQYMLDSSNLKTLDLLCGDYTVLHWIALLLTNREFTLHGELAQSTKESLLDRYLIKTSSFDLVVGYRADDAYFSYAESFVEGTLSLEGLERALHLGNLGEQIVLVSSGAFHQLSFEKASYAECEIFYPRFIARDSSAREAYRGMIQKRSSPEHGLYALDLLRMGEEEVDASVQRISR